MPGQENKRLDWIEFLAQTGRLFGISPVRTRWRLRAWQERMQKSGEKASGGAKAVTRAHKTCPRCRGINNLDQKVCMHCGARLLPRPVEIAVRFFGQFGLGLTPETMLAAGFIVVYALPALVFPSSGFLAMHPRDLAAIGGNFPALTLRGQWWRLWTAVFLHGGLWHIGFNTYALVFLAPHVREVYGAHKTMFVFLVTGVLASAVSLMWMLATGRFAVSIGASGAIMGLIGLMVAWGHRDGTGHGVSVRNHLGRWIIYIFIFGFLVGADNAAHLGGLVSGALLSLVVPTSLTRADTRAWAAPGAGSYLMAAAAVALIIYLVFANAPAG